MRSLLHLQILLIDEIDTFLRKRDSSQNEVTVRIKMEFAQALNNQLKSHGSLVVGKQAISITCCYHTHASSGLSCIALD